MLEEVNAITPDDPDVALNLGTAYLETGSSEKAMAAYEKVLAAKPTANVMNAIAYMLADHGMQVERAMELSKQASSRFEALLSSVRLEEVSPQDLKNTAELLATWDTVGWAYYKHGDLDKAKSYLTASWASMQNRYIAEHLAALYDRLGMKRQAAEFSSYAQAIPTRRTITFWQSGEDLTLLLPSPTSTVPSSITQRLQEMRIVRLSRRLEATEHAEFFVLLSPTGVADARFTSGSDVLKSWTNTLKNTKVPASFPEGSTGRLVRRGVLSCSGYNGECIFVFYAP